jgi:hypothetical protein
MDVAGARQGEEAAGGRREGAREEEGEMRRRAGEDSYACARGEQ